LGAVVAAAEADVPRLALGCIAGLRTVAFQASGGTERKSFCVRTGYSTTHAFRIWRPANQTWREAARPRARCRLPARQRASNGRMRRLAAASDESIARCSCLEPTMLQRGLATVQNSLLDNDRTDARCAAAAQR